MLLSYYYFIRKHFTAFSGGKKKREFCPDICEKKNVYIYVCVTGSPCCTAEKKIYIYINEKRAFYYNEIKWPKSANLN